MTERVTGPAHLEHLRREVIRLAPWHLDVELTPELSTAAFLDAELTPEQLEFEVSFIRPKHPFETLMRALYPKGLQGRTVLDCACNCGAYSFWMCGLGGGGGLAFDARERWIEQARFLQANRGGPATGIRFEVCELDDFPSLSSDSYDISLFKGIFYHLPDPIHSLRLVASRTRELLILNTAVRSELPDGLLAAAEESTVHPMSGVHGLNWFPTGPEVLVRILRSLMFPATRLTMWHPQTEAGPNLARVEVIGARDESAFAHFDSAPPPWVPAPVA